MIVMGGIVGSGIFINPYVVALRVHTPFLILGVWLLEGALALLGAFIWSELASRLRAEYEASAVPGHFFGLPTHFRIGMGVDTEMFHEGLQRIDRVLKVT